MVHDIAHVHGQLNIARPLDQFSKDELETYKQHPKLGAEIVAGKKFFDLSVQNIIYQHEEYIDGKGFPKGLNESKMDPLSVIAGVANALDRMIAFEGVPKNEVMKKMLITCVGKYPLNYIQVLGDIFNTFRN